MTDLSIKNLPWDSDFFGIKIGSVDFETLDYDSFKRAFDLAKSKHLKLIYGFQNSIFQYDENIIKKLNGRLIDQKVIFNIEVNSKNIKDNLVEIYESSLPNQALYKLAIISGGHSRFKIDPIFGNDNFEKLYKCWIENSINGKIADRVFIYKSQSQEINGLVTLKINGDAATIGLLSVNSDFQGQRIGQQLVDKSLLYCQKNNIKSLNVPTQLANQEACGFYKKYGFQIEKIVNIFHFYL